MNLICPSTQGLRRCTYVYLPYTKHLDLLSYTSDSRDDSKCPREYDPSTVRGTAEHGHGPLTATGETHPWPKSAGLYSIRARRGRCCESICSGGQKQTGTKLDCISRLHDCTVWHLRLHAVLLQYDYGPQLSNPGVSGSGGSLHLPSKPMSDRRLLSVPGSIVVGATKFYSRTGIDHQCRVLSPLAICHRSGRILQPYRTASGQAFRVFSPTPSGCKLCLRRSSVRSPPGLIMRCTAGQTIFRRAEI